MDIGSTDWGLRNVYNQIWITLSDNNFSQWNERLHAEHLCIETDIWKSLSQLHQGWINFLDVGVAAHDAIWAGKEPSRGRSDIRPKNTKQFRFGACGKQRWHLVRI